MHDIVSVSRSDAALEKNCKNFCKNYKKNCIFLVYVSFCRLAVFAKVANVHNFRCKINLRFG
jgi:hypothetical protein